MIGKSVAISVILALIIARAEESNANEVAYVALGAQGVKKYDLSGTLLGSFPVSAGTITADSLGSFYVSSGIGSTVVRFDVNGVFQNIFLPTPLPGDHSTSTGGLAIGPDGNLYVGIVGTGLGSTRIERFSVNGTSLGTFAMTVSNPGNLAFDPFGNLFIMGEFIEGFDSTGSSFSTFEVPEFYYDLACDSSGSIFVTGGTIGNSTIRAYSPNGELLSTINTLQQFGAIAFDSQDIMYVGLDSINPAIRRFQTNGIPLGNFVTLPRLQEVWDIAIINVIPEPSSALLAASIFALLASRHSRR